MFFGKIQILIGNVAAFPYNDADFLFFYMFSFITKLFGDPSEKKLKNYKKDLEKIKEIEKKYRDEIKTISEVQAKTHEFQSKFEGLDLDEDIKEIKERLNGIKHEALALHRRACEIIHGQVFEFGEEKIEWNMIPYDVQVLGALALNDGNIAEMRTGEGKTLVATLAAYLNALVGHPVHVVTVNDYLARRDAKEMSIIYNTLGLSVGVITHNQGFQDKKISYSANVVYATNNELGFDYLRDNMASDENNRVMKRKWFAIVDEVDSILVDEARTPLIISAPAAEATSQYVRFAAIARNLENEKEYKIDEKQKTATLTEDGIRKLEEILGVDNIYVSQHYNDIHHIENALKAAAVYKRDVDYLVRDGEILIIDEHTGRVLSGRRYSDGLHQAIEAKEGVTIQQESRTLASVTFQNYFRLYKKLSGMTGTAKTEEEEFYKIYSLEVITVPTNRPIARIDRGDLLFRSEKGKFDYIVRLIEALHEKGQPVLVGTVSVAKSEYLSSLLSAKNIPHEVLNAKQDAREADIVSNAGKYGAVTIATNMAGRGTDIKIDDRVRNLDGEVILEGAAGKQTYKLGGLFVIGTEKHETRRIDNQLRGRSGRQGDPGLSQFMISPDDDIMRIFGSNNMFRMIANLSGSHPENDPLIESKQLMRGIERVQRQVEGRNFDIRKHILEYDDVLNQHRLAIYARRNRILEGKDIHSDVVEMLENQIERVISLAYDGHSDIESDVAQNIVNAINDFAGAEIAKVSDYLDAENLEDLKRKTKNLLGGQIEMLRDTGSEEIFADFERRLTLAAIDELWMQHMDAMAHLREEVAFEGYAQKNPLVVYKERAYDSFVNMMSDIEYRVIKGLLTAKPQESIDAVELESALREDYIETGSEAVGVAHVPANSENGEISITPVDTPEINVIRLSDDKK
ncbi:preprotein translocase subunit SecA [Candidatus Gracilibacteria bacterium GN02-873]|nr:preprotein translocase subunit SecA [Candidatus Gracilibacteria bacterium GN02-873]